MSATHPTRAEAITPTAAPAALPSNAQKAAVKAPAKANPKAPAKAAPQRTSKPTATPAAKPAAAAKVKPAAKPVTKVATKPVKAAKPVKQKLVRDSFTFPETEYQALVALKKRLLAAGTEVKKGELMRAGLALLTTLDDVALTAAVARVEKLKTGRPAK